MNISCPQTPNFPSGKTCPQKMFEQHQSEQNCVLLSLLFFLLVLGCLHQLPDDPAPTLRNKSCPFAPAPHSPHHKNNLEGSRAHTLMLFSGSLMLPNCQVLVCVEWAEPCFLTVQGCPVDVAFLLHSKTVQFLGYLQCPLYFSFIVFGYKLKGILILLFLCKLSSALAT